MKHLEAMVFCNEIKKNACCATISKSSHTIEMFYPLVATKKFDPISTI